MSLGTELNYTRKIVSLSPEKIKRGTFNSIVSALRGRGHYVETFEKDVNFDGESGADTYTALANVGGALVKIKYVEYEGCECTDTLIIEAIRHSPWVGNQEIRKSLIDGCRRIGSELIGLLDE